MTYKVMIRLPDDREVWIGQGAYPTLTKRGEHARRFHSIINARDAIRAWEDISKALDYAIPGYAIYSNATGMPVEVIE